MKEYLLIDFIAAGADGGTDSDPEVSGQATKFGFHPSEDLCRDLVGRSLPSRMNPGDHLLCLVDDEDGETICGLNAKESVGRIGDHGIIFQTGRRVILGFSQDKNSVLMDLMKENESMGVEAEGGCNQAFIPGDMIF